MCTDFILPFDQSNPLIITGKTMDFVKGDYNLQVKKFPVGYATTSPAPHRGQGIQWTSQYGFVCIVAMYGEIDRPNDGLNTAGLSVSGQWLAYSKLAAATPKNGEQDYLHSAHLVAYILGTCARIEEVQDKLNQLKIWKEPNQVIGHLSIHDARGKSLVVEFIKGEVKFYQNDIGVMTNGPAFDWQSIHFNYFFNALNATNNALNKHVELTEQASGPSQITSGNGYEYEVLGAGMQGLPGDSTSPSRFVRAGKLRLCIPELSAGSETERRQGVQYALQVLGRISVCEQEVRLYFDSQGQMSPPQDRPYHSTLWKVIRNHTDLIFYYCTNQNQSIQAIKLRELDFNDGCFTQTPLYAETPWFNDRTQQLKP